VFKFGSAHADDFAMTPNTAATKTLVSDESVIGCTLDEVSVVVLGDRHVVVPIAREAAEASGFELADVAESELLALGILPRAAALPVSEPAVIPAVAAPTVVALPVSVDEALVGVTAPMPDALSIQASPQSEIRSAQAPTPPPVPATGPSPSSASGPAFRELSSLPSPEAPTAQVTASPTRFTPAPAPDFSAWPYVDRRSLTVDDDVPTAQNFLNVAVTSERRGRNADIAPVQSAPFGDVPRAYDSPASDTRAKREAPAASVQSTVQIGMASLPQAPQPTVVPSPTAGPGSYDPQRANALPEPIVIPAPTVPVTQTTAPIASIAPIAPVVAQDPIPEMAAPREIALASVTSATAVPALVAQVEPAFVAPVASAVPASVATAVPALAEAEESSLTTSISHVSQAHRVAQVPTQPEEPLVHVDDIADSPLARLLAAQSSTKTEPLSTDRVSLIDTPMIMSPASNATIDAAVVQHDAARGTQVGDQLGGQQIVQSVGGNPFSAPKVGRLASIFDAATPAETFPGGASVNAPLWSTGTDALPQELAPMSSIFGTQKPVLQNLEVLESEKGQPKVEQVPVVFAANVQATTDSVVNVQAVASTAQKLDVLPAAAEPAPRLTAEPVVTSDQQESRSAQQTPSVLTAALAGQTNLSIEPVESLDPIQSIQPIQPIQPIQSRLSPEALQQVYSFDEEDPEDLVPLLVSDRLVLRWSQSASDAVRVSSVALSVGWPSKKPLVSNLDIDLASGDILVVDGPERSGKTALLKTFAGHVAPLHGDVSLDGQSLGSVEGTDFRRREALSLSYVGANSLLVSDLSLVENIELPLLAEGVSPHDARPAALAWLESVGLNANAHLPAGSLSSSDARIAAVIRTLIVGPALVCVDDVTSGMGISSARMVLALLEHAQSTGTVLLIATNDARLEFDGGYRANIEAGELVPVD
jgi:putative ABC transport system ATP-binding protein